MLCQKKYVIFYFRAGFGYMWAGVRSTHGATKGRVCFEVKIDNNQPTDHLQNETTPNVLRCGWYDFLLIPTVGLQKTQQFVMH